MYTITPEDFNPVFSLISEYLRTRSKNIAFGNTQREKARNEGHQLGFQSGIREALAAFVNQARCERYGKFDRIASVVGSSPDVGGFLCEACDFYDQTEDSNMAWVHIGVLWEKVCFPEDMEENEVNRHREAVLEGTEEPTVADENWLAEMEAVHQEKAKRFDELFKKAQANA